MAYDSAATKARLLDAAYAEFAAVGFAGASVNRIAADANANKQAIYAYFDSKEGLFDAVIQQRIGVLADQVPFTPDDFPSYIGALFDHLDAHPQLARITQWKVLERPDGSSAETQSHVEKAQQLAHALGIDPGRGMDLLMFALALAQAWSTTSIDVRTLGTGDPARKNDYRRELVRAVAALITDMTRTEQDPR